MAQRAYPPAERARALKLYAELGPAEASRQTGIPSATIRSWAKRAGATVARNEAAQAAIDGARLTWAQRRATVARLAGEAAERLVHAVISATDRGKSRDAREYAGALAIAVDKAQLLEGEATGRLELSDSELLERAKRLRQELAERDELTARRERRAAAAGG